MVDMMDRGLGALTRIPPLPPFVTPQELIRDALPLLDPPSRVSVTEAAETYLRVPVAGEWRRYDRMVTPYMIEPQDVSQSRRFKGVVFVGPAQSGKTQMLLSVSAHAICCAFGPVQLIHMTKTDADAWVEEKLDPAIQNSPELRDRLGRGRDDSTFSRKRFRGTRLSIGYPVANQLSSRSQRMVLLTDYDHMNQVLGPKDAPEGSPFDMAMPRVRTYMSRGCVVAESTPAFPVNEEAYQPVSPLDPHKFPAVSAGIVTLYNQGTRARWHWECPDCAGLFEPTFDLLDYDRDLDPGDAGAGAVMVCPQCGAIIEHRDKVTLNRRAAQGHGGWLHEGRSIDTDEDGKARRRLVRITDPDIRNVGVASYALNGVAATFVSWASLVEQYESARREFEATGDDLRFARCHYTDLGVPYRRPKIEDGAVLTVEHLKAQALSIEQGIAPEWARFVLTCVDAQGNRFEVTVMAFGAEGERVIIDRFAMFQPPDDAPRAKGSDGKYRSIDPGRYGEDAEVLAELADRVYPVAGQGWGLRPLAVVIDFNGPKGWSDNAEQFWRKRARAGDGARFYLSIGRAGFQQRDRVWHEAPERASNGKRARGIKLLNMAVDRLKDSVSAALEREDSRINAQHVPGWMEDDHIAELIAEIRTEKGWVKKPGVQRNETLDNSVQALALAEFLGINRVNWEAPPAWCVLGPSNMNAVVIDAPDGTNSAAPVATPPAIPKRIAYLS